MSCLGQINSTLKRAVASGVTKKHQKIIFEYWVFSQKSNLNMGCFEKTYLHTKNVISAYRKFDICILSKFAVRLLFVVNDMVMFVFYGV